MGILYILFIILGAIILITALVGLTQPRQFNYTASIQIVGSYEQIKANVVKYENFIQWSPWSEKDLKMIQSLPEKDGEVGAKYSWAGNRQVGMGSMTLVENSDHKVVHDLVFGKRPAAQAIFEIERVNDSYVVSWTLNTDMGINPLGRAFVPVMKKMIGKDFNHGLSKLKKLIENA